MYIYITNNKEKQVLYRDVSSPISSYTALSSRKFGNFLAR